MANRQHWGVPQIRAYPSSAADPDNLESDKFGSTPRSRAAARAAGTEKGISTPISSGIQTEWGWNPKPAVAPAIRPALPASGLMGPTSTGATMDTVSRPRVSPYPASIAAQPTLAVPGMDAFNNRDRNARLADGTLAYKGNQTLGLGAYDGRDPGRVTAIDYRGISPTESHINTPLMPEQIAAAHGSVRSSADIARSTAPISAADQAARTASSQVAERTSQNVADRLAIPMPITTSSTLPPDLAASDAAYNSTHSAPVFPPAFVHQDPGFISPYSLPGALPPALAASDAAYNSTAKPPAFPPSFVHEDNPSALATAQSAARPMTPEEEQLRAAGSTAQTQAQRDAIIAKQLADKDNAANRTINPYASN